MPATLQQIQDRLEQAIALRDETAETCQALAEDALICYSNVSSARQVNFNAKLQGYQRVVELLMKIERDLVANGRAAENDLRILSGFDAPQAISALPSASLDCDAQKAPREAPRNEAAVSPAEKVEPGFATPLPAAGDVF